MSSKYLPDAEPKLIPWGDNFVENVDRNKEAWGIPVAEVTEVKTVLTDFKSLYERARSPGRTTVIVEEKNTVKALLKAKIRAMVGFRLKNPIITDAQRKELGLHVADKTRSPKPRPTTYPKFHIVQNGVGMLSIIFQEGDGRKGSKPPEAVGVRIYYGVFDEQPSVQEELPASVFGTRCPCTITFRETDRGKRAYIALRWENSKGEGGPWSEIISEIIP
ncbi:MAG: hypothetical protein LBK00_06780 [Treponema sp.]|jgi:hypothetical protein|nr:hypothetical protein [Treponema sp.]